MAALIDLLGARYELAVFPTRGPRDAIELGREAARREDAAAFAWGGDGTVREVVEGILGSEVALGVLPGGTFNVVARTMGLPRSPVAAAARLLASAPALRDAGLIADSPFLMQATMGLDGFLMSEMRADMKARFGFGGAVYEGIRALFRYRFPTFGVEVDGVAHEVTGAGFVNLAEYAGLYQFVPGARWDDGQGHVLLYRGRSRLAAVGFAISLALGRHHQRSDVQIMEARQLTVLGPVHVQADGDPWRGPLPATCRISPDGLRVLIPAR